MAAWLLKSKKFANGATAVGKACVCAPGEACYGVCLWQRSARSCYVCCGVECSEVLTVLVDAKIQALFACLPTW
eukprot:994806-Amphidinium_carterae.1